MCYTFKAFVGPMIYSTLHTQQFVSLSRVKYVMYNAPTRITNLISETVYGLILLQNRKRILTILSIQKTRRNRPIEIAFRFIPISRSEI